MGVYLRVDEPVQNLCFTANTANSTVQLNKVNYPTAVTLETSTDGSNWSTYTFNTAITLSNVGDKVYFRNTSTTDTGFSIKGTGYYQFVMTGSIAASGDVTTLLNKNGTDTITVGCFINLFSGCSSLTTPPIISATTLGEESLYAMFYLCSNLVTLPKIYATNLGKKCFQYMFNYCSKIKLSASKTGDYQTEYRIPISGTGVDAGNAAQYMFSNTGGTFTGTPSINTTYYTSNTVV